MDRLLHRRGDSELIQVDEQEQQSSSDALAALRAAGIRLRDPELESLIRNVRWQFAHLEQRVVTAEGEARKATAQAENLMRQRDRALAECRDMPARLERQATEMRRAIQQAKDAISERDEARWNWDRIRAENQKLRSENGALGGKTTAAAPAPKAPKPKVSEAVANLPPIEPSAEEAAMMAARAQVVAAVDRLIALGKKRNPAQQAELVALQDQLGKFAPQVKAYKMQRHAKKMALEAEVIAAEAMKAAGLA